MSVYHHSSLISSSCSGRSHESKDFHLKSALWDREAGFGREFRSNFAAPRKLSP